MTATDCCGHAQHQQDWQRLLEAHHKMHFHQSPPAGQSHDCACVILLPPDVCCGQAAASYLHEKQQRAENFQLQGEVGPHLRPRDPEQSAVLEQAGL